MTRKSQLVPVISGIRERKQHRRSICGHVDCCQRVERLGVEYYWTCYISINFGNRFEELCDSVACRVSVPGFSYAKVRRVPQRPSRRSQQQDGATDTRLSICPFVPYNGPDMHMANQPVMSPTFFKPNQGIVIYSGDGQSHTVLYEGYDCSDKTCITQTMVVKSRVR